MIKVGSSGRLANHLFQYAFALTAAQKLNTTFEYDTSLLEKYFLVKKKNKLFTKIKKRLIPESKWNEIHVNNLSEPKTIIANLKNEILYSGYFQSEDFFNEYQGLVRSAFSVKPEILKNFKEKYKNILSTDYSCIAIRLSDYKNWIVEDGLYVSPLLPFNFFEAGINKLESKENLVFISDEIETVKNIFSLKYPKAYFNEICSDPIEDFLLLSHAKNSVISNSSFYWWACWLNSNKEKKVIAPKYWLGFRKNVEYPTSIIPKEWIQLQVTEN